MSEALVVRNDQALQFNFTVEACRLKEEALAVGACIGKVTNAEEQQSAVSAQQAVATLLRTCEKARVAAKQPILEFGRLIDSQAQQFVAELKTEEMRLAKLVGDFQKLEEARIRAAQQAENERLLELEREKARALQQAQSHQEMEKIQEQFQTRAQNEAIPIAAPVRAAGQSVSNEWEFEVTDKWALARAHPACVNIEPRASEIKAILKSGGKVAGVRAWQETKARVRSTPTPKALEV